VTLEAILIHVSNVTFDLSESLGANRSATPDVQETLSDFLGGKAIAMMPQIMPR
jgi:hypothetical protein